MLELVEAGYVADERGFFTEDGLDTLEEQGVKVSEIHTLLLGRQLTVRIKGENIHIKAGSRVYVLFGGYDRNRRSKYVDCFVHTDLPIMTIYQNSADVFETHRWPEALNPLELFQVGA